MNKTIYKMLTENTGIAMMDSGGSNNRAWQQNQGKTLQDFKNEAEVTHEFDYGYTISLFHYLTNQLELDSICKEFNTKFDNMEEWGGDIFGVSDEAYNWLMNGFNCEIGTVFNSYNGESFLSQVIQGRYLTINSEHYVLLQIHGGCDVRGGYTDSKLFKIDNDYMEFLSPENVYGTVTRKNGKVIQVDNNYDGYNLTNENGKVVKIRKSDVISLSL